MNIIKTLNILTMKLRNVTRLLLYAFVIACIAPSCVKEGPMGLTGAAGADGKDGKDANETCKICHTSTKVDLIATQFEFSKHSYGDAALATTTGVVYDGNPTGTTNIIKPSYRTHTHYGAIGAVYAGMGGVEFPGTLAYTSSAHTQSASCVDCHMGTMVGRSGGHTFS